MTSGSHRPADQPAGVCADDVPPLLGALLTGTDLTLDAAAERLLRGDPLPPLTDVQLRLVQARAAEAA